MNKKQTDQKTTVKELIHILQQLPPDLRVVVAGYEGGWSDVTNAKVARLALNVNIEEWYYGDHETIPDKNDEGDYTEYEREDAVLIW